MRCAAKKTTLLPRNAAICDGTPAALSFFMGIKEQIEEAAARGHSKRAENEAAIQDLAKKRLADLLEAVEMAAEHNEPTAERAWSDDLLTAWLKADGVDVEVFPGGSSTNPITRVKVPGGVK